MFKRPAALAAVLAWDLAIPASRAEAYEMLELRSDQSRVAVIVLAYEDHWTSYAGEALWDGYLQVLMRKRYSRLYVARGKGLTLVEIQDAMKAALATGLTVDFMTSTHSSSDAILLGRGLWVRPVDIVAPLLNGTSREQLEMAANFGCHSDGQTGQFESLGFRSYVGNEGISVGSLAMRAFLKRWLHRRDDLMTAVEWTNDHLDRMFTRNPVAKAIFRALAKEKDYTAVMKGFGENLRFCR